MNNILTLTEHGNHKYILDIENKKSEKIEFMYVGNDVYIAVAPKDLTVFGKDDKIIDVKKDQIIVKSNCRDVLEIIDSNPSFIEVLEKIKEISKYNEEVEKETICDAID